MRLMAVNPQRLTVSKTYKLFIGGAFPRSESGRYLIARTPNGDHVANYCNASRKDLRDAVRLARAAQPGWQNASAFLRGQILYRAAEMLENRRGSFLPELTLLGLDAKSAGRQLDLAIDRLVYYAGWTDKLAAVFGSVNPVSSPHWNVTSPEPCGVVAVICPDSPSLLGLVTLLAAALVPGNAVVAIASEKEALSAISLAEVLAVSDLPAGVVNILTGIRSELAPALASHHEIQAILDAGGDPAVSAVLAEGASTNLKRVTTWHGNAAQWESEDLENPYRILDTVEFKTAWHPSAL
jgi:acyl-CoA reductase-like NAD-dependent aldehyde dehydrogenase